LDTKVSNSNEEIAHLIDVSVASKVSTNIAHATHGITQSVASTLADFKDQFSRDFETNLPQQVRSIVLQRNDENPGNNLMHVDNSRLPSNIHTPGALVNVTQSAVKNVQCGQNYASTSANNFVPRVADPIVSTSVPQNYSSNNRSVSFNSNLQQPNYQTVAYNTSPLPPMGTGVPYGPVPDAYFNSSPQQTTHAQIFFAGDATTHLCSTCSAN
jgi:hypothetical protein